MSNKIFTLIPKIMADVGSIGKDGKNAAQNYRFRGIEQMYNSIQPVLVRHGVFCVPQVMESVAQQFDGVNQRGEAKLSYRVLLKINHKFYADDGSFVEVITQGEGIDTSDKASNKAMSAAMKYAFIELLSIPTEDVEDSDRDHPEVDTRRPAPPLSSLVKPKAAEPAPEPFPMSNEERAYIDREYGPPPASAQPELREPGADEGEDPDLFRVEFGKSAGKTLRQLGVQEVMNLRRFLEGASRLNPEKRDRHIAACDQYLRKQGVLQTA